MALASLFIIFFFFFNDTATTEIYTLSLHDALPIFSTLSGERADAVGLPQVRAALLELAGVRSEEHTSELQSHLNLVCRLLLEKKKNKMSSLSKYITLLTRVRREAAGSSE